MDMRNPSTTHLESGTVSLGAPGSTTNAVTGLEEKGLLPFLMLAVSFQPVPLSHSLPRLTSLHEVTGSNQATVAGTNNNSLPDIAVARVLNIAIRLDDTVGMKTAD